MDTKGGKLRWGGDDGVLNWAIGIDMYKVMCIKLMTDLKKKMACVHDFNILTKLTHHCSKSHIL